MKINNQDIKVKFYSVNLLFAILFFVVGFPRISLACGTGLDSGYQWALNWLFINDYQQLIHLTYPLGPLGFLKSPIYLGNNFLLALCFFTILKIALLFGLLNEREHNPTSILLVLIVSYFTNNIDFVIIPFTIFLCYKILDNFSTTKFISACVIASISLFIKLSIGICSISVLLAYLAIDFYQKRAYKNTLKKTGIFCITLIIIGLIIFRSIGLFFSYAVSSAILSMGYSESLSLFPTNNWWSIGLFFASFGLFFYLSRNTKTLHYLGLSAFSIFAIWKHATTREDTSHFVQFIEYVLLIWCLLFILIPKIKTYLKALPIFGLLCLHFNSTQLPYYTSNSIEFSGVHHFIEVFFDFENFKKEQEKISLGYLKQQTLEPEVLKLIGNSTIDVYPWELSYIAENKLNWKPRKTLEIGASSSEYISKLAAQNYSQNGAEIVLFHFSPDQYQGSFGSIDDKHILSNEAPVLIELLQNYTLVFKNNHYLLYQKLKQAKVIKIESEKKGKINFGEWIDLPETTKRLTTCKVDFSNTFLGNLKKLFFKQEQYFVDYQLENGKIISYRILPFSMKSGIWCNPLIRFPKNSMAEMGVRKIRLRNENPSLTRNEYRYTLETISFSKDNNIVSISNFFGKNEYVKDSIYYQDSIQNFAKPLKNHAHYVVSGGKFLGEIEIDMSKIWKDIDTNVFDLVLETSMTYLNKNSEVVAAIIINHGAEDEWSGDELPQKITWNTYNKTIILNKKDNSSSVIKLHIWNKGNNEVKVKDFKVTLSTKSIY